MSTIVTAPQIETAVPAFVNPLEPQKDATGRWVALTPGGHDATGWTAGECARMLAGLLDAEADICARCSLNPCDVLTRAMCTGGVS